MTNVRKISGFPEWLPAEKLLEDRVIEVIRGIYESHGFTPIETPAVELLSTLASKGDIQKEIYTLSRLQADPEELEQEDAESKLALHFDLTVPFARYVALHFNELQFPFRRYQLQKSWRGERPQEGRYREFAQFDIDIIARDQLPLSCDAEILTVICKVFEALSLGDFVLRLNNRKLLMGYYDSLGLSAEQREATITAVDKLHKIGTEGVQAVLAQELGLANDLVERVLKLARICVDLGECESALTVLKNVDNDLCQEGRNELLTLRKLIPEDFWNYVELDLSIARGLDYYTGTIVETFLKGHESFGSLCSGGSYADLASRFTRQKLPGVGVSIGLTRLMALIIKEGLLELAGSCPTRALVTVMSEDTRPLSNSVAEILRKRGVSTEVFFKSPKLGKQIDYADRKGIQYVLFPHDDKPGGNVKDLSTKEQLEVADFGEWAKSL